MSEDSKIIRGFAAAVLLQAVLDYRELNSGLIKETSSVNQTELSDFFSSNWFAELCKMCNIDRKLVLNNLAEVKCPAKEVSNDVRRRNIQKVQRH